MIFLRFPDEQTYLDVASPYADEDGNITIQDLDVVGLIYEGGEYDDEGNVITSPVAIDGYHVNAIEIPEDWEQYVISRPNKPHRVFAGY